MSNLNLHICSTKAKFYIFIFTLSMLTSALPSILNASENEIKYQRQHEMDVENCVCDWLELEAKNNTYLSYQRIVAGCNGLVAKYFTHKNFKPSSFSPEFNNLECRSSASKWLQSKQR